MRTPRSSRDGKNMLVGIALNVAAHPQFPALEILENRREASKMILMGMRERDHVDLLEPARP